MTNETQVIGWTEGDGSGHEGYNVADYFDANGRYLGPDEHGIEPIFQPSPEAERKARCLKQSADVKRILGGYRAPKTKKQGMTAGQFMAGFSNQGGVR